MSVTFFAQPAKRDLFVSCNHRQAQRAKVEKKNASGLTEIILTSLRRPSYGRILQYTPQVMQLVRQFHLLCFFALLWCRRDLQIFTCSG